MELTITHVSFGLSLSALVALIGYVINTSVRFGKLELKVDTMWAFQVRRSMSEIVESGYGVLNSPLVINEDAIKRLEPIKQELIDFAAKMAADMSDAEFLLEIEREFGERLLTLICVPCKLSHGACLLLAIAVARQSLVVDLKL